MARGRHVPRRTCVGCRTVGDKRGLMRVVRTPEGTVAYDSTGKASGRGAYLCCSEECIAAAMKRKVLDRHLRAAIPAEVYAALQHEAQTRAARSAQAGGSDRDTSAPHST